MFLENVYDIIYYYLKIFYVKHVILYAQKIASGLSPCRSQFEFIRQFPEVSVTSGKFTINLKPIHFGSPAKPEYRCFNNNNRLGERKSTDTSCYYLMSGAYRCCNALHTHCNNNNR